MYYRNPGSGRVPEKGRTLTSAPETFVARGKWGGKRGTHLTLYIRRERKRGSLTSQGVDYGGGTVVLGVGGKGGLKEPPAL